MIDPSNPFPMPHAKRLCFLKNIIDHPSIEIGDYTYYDDPDSVDNFVKNVLYHFDFIGDKLIIGKFCQIASHVRFIMNGGNHAISGFSTYPFAAFGDDWQGVPLNPAYKGNTVIGNDVWIGYDSIIMPGVTIGDGAIIASGSVVTHSVDPYTIVGGNPAKQIRQRFNDEIIQQLVAMAWWDWSFEKISQHASAIASGDLELLAENHSS